GLLATALGSLHDRRAGRPDPRRLTRLVSVCRDLGAGVLEAWAQAFLALASASEGLPDAAAAARTAATLASRAGVPGGYVAATVALARLDYAHSGPRDSAGPPGIVADRDALLREAEAQALAVGLPAGAVHHWAAQPRASEPEAAPPAAPAVAVERTPPVSIRCFGGFQMDIGRQPVEINTVRARARS